MTELEKLRDECLACRRCRIGGVLVAGKFLSNVFSNMNEQAKIMVVGQNPGGYEVEKAEPFVGISGKFFDQLVAEVLGMTRKDFYISNCVRCFSPGNRELLQEELDNCRVFLDKEVEIVKPKVILALGGPAFKQITGMRGIMKHHGELVFSPRYKVFIMPLLHPSPLNMNRPDNRKLFYDDLWKLRAYLDKLEDERLATKVATTPCEK